MMSDCHNTSAGEKRQMSSSHIPPLHQYVAGMCFTTRCLVLLLVVRFQCIRFGSYTNDIACEWLIDILLAEVIYLLRGSNGRLLVPPMQVTKCNLLDTIFDT